MHYRSVAKGRGVETLFEKSEHSSRTHNPDELIGIIQDGHMSVARSGNSP